MSLGSSRLFSRGDQRLGTINGTLLGWGWVFLERTQILSGIQFTTHFFEILVVETKRFVGSSVTVIITRQTCGQRSSRAAESKRQALGNHFSERICYMFQISKCRGDQDLSLCTTSVLAFGELQRNGKIRFFLRRNTFFSRKSPLPGTFRELDEVCSGVPEDSRVSSGAVYGSRPPIASKPGSSPPERPGLDNETSQP